MQRRVCADLAVDATRANYFRSKDEFPARIVLAGLFSIWDRASTTPSHQDPVTSPASPGILPPAEFSGEDSFAGEPPCERGCENVARQIQEHIGGNVVRIAPRDTPALGGFRGKNWGWGHHEVVVKDGRVFDVTTGHQGLPIPEYKQLWQYPDAINFGF